MALGVPVVATSICCPGLGVEAQKHLLAADGPQEFARAVELVLDHETIREKLIAAARDYVERHHNWAGSLAALANSYHRAVADFKRGAGAIDSGLYRPAGSGAAGSAADSPGSI